MFRFQSGDYSVSLTPAQRHSLFDDAMKRFQLLAQKSLRYDFSDVRRWFDTNDVVNSAGLKLWTRVTDGTITTQRHFLGYAGDLIRQTLLDMAKHLNSSRSFAANHETLMGNPPEPNESDVYRLRNLEKWTQFHEAVLRLPDDDRELFNLFWYHGKTTGEVARILEVSDSSVDKRWRRARVRLHKLTELAASPEA